MRKLFLLLTLIFCLTFSYSGEIAIHIPPTYNLDFIMTFDSLEPPARELKYSNYEFPKFKEDEYLIIKKIIISNNSDVNSPSGYVNFKFKTPQRTIENAFGSSGFQIPSIEPDLKLEIEFQKVEEKSITDENIIYYRFKYLDDFEREYYLRPVKLFDVGTWSFEPKFEPTRDSNFSGGTYGFGYLKGNELTNFDFKVRGTSEETMLGASLTAVFFAIIAILINSISNLARELNKIDREHNLIDKVLLEQQENRKLLKTRKTKFKLKTFYLKDLLDEMNFNIEGIQKLYSLLQNSKEFNNLEKKYKKDKDSIFNEYLEISPLLIKGKILKNSIIIMVGIQVIVLTILVIWAVQLILNYKLISLLF